MDFLLKQSQVLLNPRWPENELKVLYDLSKIYPLENHFWVASSGSSAEQISSVKLIAISQSAILASAEAVNVHLQASSQDIWAQCLPSFHVGGMGVEARAYLTQSKVHSGLVQEDGEKRGKWDPRFCYQILQEKKITLTAMVPAQIFDLVQLGFLSPPALRAVVVGGAFLAQELYDKALGLGWPLLPSFGMTECASQVATAELGSWNERKRDLKILNHMKVRRNSEGFLEVQSPALLTGYAQMKNDKPVWQDPKVEGWFLTEDHAEIHQNFLFPTGRNSDFIKILGEGVNLFKLQQRLDSLISETEFSWDMTLITTPDPRTENRICLVASQNVPLKWIQETMWQFNQQVAPFEKIQEHKIIAQIPRTALGKISKAELIRRFGRS